MPVGVEHNLLVAKPSWVRGVPLPLMPVGVEHPSKTLCVIISEKVPLPLMPVGVEHGKALVSAAGIRRCLYL